MTPDRERDGGPVAPRLAPLRDELARRQVRRARRRLWLRWRRRRLLIKLVAIERELANASDERMEQLMREADRVAARLKRNATRLFR